MTVYMHIIKNVYTSTFFMNLGVISTKDGKSDEDINGKLIGRKVITRELNSMVLSGRITHKIK